MPILIEKEFSNEVNFLQRQNSIQMEPSLINEVSSFNNPQLQNTPAPSIDINLLQPQQSIQPEYIENNINQLSFNLPQQCSKPEICDCLNNLTQNENPIFQIESNLQQPEQSEPNQYLQTQSAPHLNQNLQSNDNKIIEPQIKSDQQIQIPQLDLKMQDSFKLNEQQKNMVDYAFLNDQDGLDRIYVPSHSEKEYKNIMKATNYKIKQLTLNHDGHHFKQRNDFQRRPRQISNTSANESQFKSPNRKLNSFVTGNTKQQVNTIKNQPYNQNNNQYNYNPKQIQQRKQQLSDAYSQQNSNQQTKSSSSTDQSQSKQLSIKIGDQFLTSSGNGQDISQSTNFNDSQQFLSNQYNQQINHDELNFEDHEGHRMRNDEESFEKSSINLTSEQWQCIQQLQKHKKKNVAKNIMTAFKNFISNPMKFGYTQQQICTALSCYNRSKKSEESFDEMQNKFMKYIVKKKFNHYTIKLLIQHPNYGEVFEYFLRYLSDFWLEQSKVHDIEAHQAMIKFLKEAYNDIEIINQLKKYDKRKY